MKSKYEKGTKKIRREPPVFEFRNEVTLVRLAPTRVRSYRTIRNYVSP